MLLDTSGLLCFLHKDEPQHERAVELIATTSRSRLTHNYVLAELVALALVRGFSRSIVLSYSLELINNSNVQIVWVDERLHREAIDLLLARQDKTYSLCDAVSFVLMRRQGIIEALTTDKHFEQEGFTRLLRSAG
ncbi:MAG: PIN domain-containing protein [Nostoc sp. DedQUE05]|uniref:type II toxin-antitoxin system VapC family toxin n=1 Tax=Nostoc sp. DedQUE05 TaxID=3075391 RepID=UPI002AD2A4C9|nr:PIN domain-containing protein [Nostoc sp. DedQUE05]MDZ8096355.1 PIN domain-containing protein [Nostoc sp. DedQUE05]